MAAFRLLVVCLPGYSIKCLKTFTVTLGLLAQDAEKVTLCKINFFDKCVCPALRKDVLFELLWHDFYRFSSRREAETQKEMTSSVCYEIC